MLNTPVAALLAPTLTPTPSSFSITTIASGLILPASTHVYNDF
jgi:hypothetical protein